MNQLRLRSILALCLLLATTSIPFAQTADSTARKGIFDLLQSDEETELTLVMDLDSLLLKAKRSEQWFSGELRYKLSKKGAEEILPLRIKGRGKFRRMTCSFPPLKLKFKKDDLKDKGLNKYNELKLVTHCIDEKLASKDLILREYLAYKLYNLLTPNSFRVQLVKVTYENKDGKGDKIKRLGILIEDSEELADRIGGKIAGRMGMPLDSLHVNQEKIASLFQFMVSNCDFSLMLSRNVEFVLLPDNRYMVIPYDFDFSGMVAAPYSRADVRLGQKTVRDRVFLGQSKTLEEMTPAIRYFLSKKEEILETVDNFSELDATPKEDIYLFLSEFFTLMEDEKAAKKALFEPRPGAAKKD